MKDKKIACRICKRRFNQINNTHLSKHGMTVDEYKEKFPNAKTTSDATSKRRSESVIGVKNPFYGKHHNQDSLEIISKCSMGNTYYRDWKLKKKHDFSSHDASICKCVRCKSLRGECDIRGKTWEELYGIKKSDQMKCNLSKSLTGRSLSNSHRKRVIRNLNTGWPHKPDCKCACCKAIRSGPHSKGKTWVDMYGKKRADEMKKNQSKCGKNVLRNLWEERNENGWTNPVKGKTYEEILGIERANERKREVSIVHSGKKFTSETRKKISIAKKGVTWEMQYGKERADEMRRKMSDRVSFDNNPNWRGGYNNEPYDAAFNGNMKEYIRDRDNYTCLLCKVKENSHAHDVHHIDNDKKNSVELNLITLCRSCHSKIDFNRKVWQKVLEEYQQCRFGKK